MHLAALWNKHISSVGRWAQWVWSIESSEAFKARIYYRFAEVILILEESCMDLLLFFLWNNLILFNISCFLLLFLNMLLILERERNINCSLPYMAQPCMKTHNLPMCSEQKSNPQPFDVWDDVSITEPCHNFFIYSLHLIFCVNFMCTA